MRSLKNLTQILIWRIVLDFTLIYIIGAEIFRNEWQTAQKTDIGKGKLDK